MIDGTVPLRYAGNSVLWKFIIMICLSRRLRLSRQRRFNSGEFLHFIVFFFLYINCVSQSVRHSTARSPGSKPETCFCSIFIRREKEHQNADLEVRQRAHCDWSIQEVKPIGQQSDLFLISDTF